MYIKMIKRRIISIIAALVFLVAISGCSAEEKGSVYMNINDAIIKRIEELCKEKNIVVCIILSFVTCGLYGIYWLYLGRDS